MIKKQYMTPVVEEIKLNSVNLLIVSGGGGDISEPPGWGGAGGSGIEPEAPPIDITPEELLGIPF